MMGFATLFLELALIRYLAGNIWNLGYFPNLVLIAAFVGMGLGFTFHQRVSPRVSTVLLHTVPFVLLGLVLFVYFKRPTVPGFSAWQGNLGGDLYFTATPQGVAEQSYAPFVFCLVTIISMFAFLAQRTAKLFRKFQPLTAYTLDIAGSCAGVLLFVLISWLTIPASWWFALVALALLVALDDRWRTRFVPVVPGLALFFMVSYQDTQLVADPSYTGPLEAYWSPYQKVEYVDLPQNPRRIFVNGVSHQHMESPQTVAASFYQPVYTARHRDQSVRPYRNVLILGAGAGSDVMAALINGAEHVDAVEIDPIIARLGKEHNPYRAYQSPKVNLVIDDGRAFMTRTTRRYDLIVFALTDSLVKVSPMSQLRLENYLFTLQSVGRAFELLAPRGDLVFYNFYRQPWLREKIEQLVVAVTGDRPREIYRRRDFAVLLARREAATAPAAVEPPSWVPTDDWPFLYLEGRGIPHVYGAAMLVMCIFVTLLLTLLHSVTRKSEGYGGKGLLSLKLAFVFMGAAFLLLDTKSVVQFSLLFGTTWLNNSLVFLAVLLLVLLANWTALLVKSERWLWLIFTLLIASSVGSFVTPLRTLLHVESFTLRFVLASVMTFAPIFFANLVFSISFRDQQIAEHIFGWNLIGAVLGGSAEYASMLLGYRFLGLLVALCYTAVLGLLVLSRRAHRAAPAAELGRAASA